MLPALVLAVFMIAGCGSEELAQLESAADEWNVSGETSSSIYVTTENITETEFENSDAGQSDTKELAKEPQQEESPQISIIMVGDILLHTPVEKAALQEDGSYNYDAIFTNLKEEIQDADLAIVNQEVILGGEELGISGYPAFNAPFTVGDALVEAGFDVVCHGTNHALDKGKKGLLNCLSYWQESYPEIGVLGIHDSEESQDSIYIYEQDGMKVAVLNYTYGTNGIELPEDMPYAVDLLTEEKVIADIRKAEELADFTIVCPHWGTEYQLVQSKTQEKWAGIFVEHGVDLVLGTHPHVIQPIAKVTDEESGHEMLVYYSLGNFVNWTSESGAGIANRMVGGMAQVTLERGEDGKVCISEYGVEPVVCHLEQGVNGVTVYKLAGYTEELAGKNQIRLQDNAFSKEYCEDLCDEVWSGIAW
ncbi:MAG: CapA family protein [Lachnospiraceae bacterium]|nr:CapA family protein [Lachnospiraceae bacterium]